MFKTIAFVSALMSVALAQSTSLSAPSGISTSCATFYESFNKDTSLDSCTSSIIAATSNFTPGSTASTSSITSALDTICSSNACSESAIRTKLTEFYSSCTAELTSNQNVDVIKMYDMMYTIWPLKQSMCVKDDDTSYCLPKTASKSGAADSVGQYVVDQTVLNGPNATAIGTSNLPFLFLNPSLSSTDLCTTCTRNVLTSYISWESTINYAPGLASTQLLVGQKGLYEGVVKTCGTSFLSGSVAAAGGISSKYGNKNSGIASASAQGIFSTVLGAVAVALVSLF